MTTRQRIPELDGLRGLAAILVVLFHALPDSLFFWGWSGVDLFFVLSGFLITTIIFAQGKSPNFLRSFYLRRIFRIWPVYYLTLAAVLLANYFSAHGFPTTGLVSHLVFLQNCQKYVGWPVPTFIGTFWPSWSVAVEEQYYLIWPLLLPLLGRRGIPAFSISLLAASWADRLLLPTTFELLGTRGDGLAMGCLLAWLLDARMNPDGKRMAGRCVAAAGLAGGAYVVLFLIRFWMDQNPGWALTRFTGFSLLYFAVIGCCVLHSGSPLLAVFRGSLLRWFGTVSYALYLFHLPLLTYPKAFFAPAGVHSPVVQNVITGILIIALPAASWYCLERPILRWKESLLRSPPETEAILRATLTPPAR